MKKRKRERVLALILVFVLASVVSVANATLSWTVVDQDGNDVEIGDIVLITVSSDVAESITWGVYLDPTSDFDNGYAELQNAVVLLPAAGNAASVTPEDITGVGYAGHNYESKGGGPNAPVVGDWSTVEFVGFTAGTYTIDLYQPAGGGQVVTADIVVLPEPATIALLGLGGLLLMRRRK